MDSKVVVWIREFLLGGQQSEEVRVTSGVPQGSVLGPLLFLAYVNDIWRYTESTIRLFADDCVIYRKIINNEDMEKLQKVLDSSCKYLGIILRSDLSWADKVNYTVKNAWKAIHLTVRILKKGNSNTKSLAYGHLYARFLIMGPRAGIRTGRDKKVR